MSTHVNHYLTPSEYLDLERKAEHKSEYWRGEIFAMSGASRAHSALTMDLALILGSQLRGKPCQIFSSDLRVYVPAVGLYTYPDLSAVCGEPEFQEQSFETLLNPTLLVEILSPSTEAYDRGLKFERYRRITSLRQYLLIAQDRVHVELFTRGEDGLWWLTDSNSREDTVALDSIGCGLPLGELYLRIPGENGVATSPDARE